MGEVGSAWAEEERGENEEREVKRDEERRRHEEELRSKEVLVHEAERRGGAGRVATHLLRTLHVHVLQCLAACAPPGSGTCPREV